MRLECILTTGLRLQKLKIMHRYHIRRSLVYIMIEIPNLRRDVLTRGNIKNFHALTMSGVKTFLGRLVNYLPLLGMRPFLVPTLAMTRAHLDFFTWTRKWICYGSARVLSPQLEFARKRKELSCRHEIVTHILAKIKAEIIKLMKSETR